MQELQKLTEQNAPTLSIKLFNALIDARASIAELNGYCVALPNPMLVLSPAIIKESLASSEIENIHTTLIEALQNNLFPEVERKQADKEVLRYREAILWGYEQIKQGFPLVNRIIIGIQHLLMEKGATGYRIHQNVIWNPKSQEIIFTPPKSQLLDDYMKDWGKFVNGNPHELDPLIKIAMAHYQFESIHPFDDGNGRTGRILMVLDLVQSGLLKYPILYLSGYINKHKSQYYQGFQSIHQNQNQQINHIDHWENYLLFMLQVFASQAKETKRVFIEIIHLLEQHTEKVKITAPKMYSKELIETLFTHPIVTPISFAENLSIHYTTASRYLKQLEKIGILQHEKIGKNQFYMNHKLIKILK